MNGVKGFYSEIRFLQAFLLHSFTNILRLYDYILGDLVKLGCYEELYLMFFKKTQFLQCTILNDICVIDGFLLGDGLRCV